MVRRLILILTLILVACATLAGGLVAVLRPPRIPVPPLRPLLLEGVTVVNPGLSRVDGRSLRLDNGRIESIAAAAAGAGGPFAGAFVLPGLIDLHVHHPPAWAPGERDLQALLFLAHGVTSVRDTGSFFGGLADFAERIERGALPGPRLFRCGPVVDGPGSQMPGVRVVANATEGARVVETLAADGVHCIKVYHAIEWDAYLGVRDAASEAGLPLVVHAPLRIALSGLGPVEVQHLMGISNDWRRVRERDVARYAEVSRERNLTHTPTLVAFDRWARLDSPAELRRAAASSLVPAHYTDFLWDLEQNALLRAWRPIGADAAAPRLAAMKEAVGVLHRAGVRILAGTDTGHPFVVPGAALHEELGLLVSAGLTPEQAWAAATREAGTTLRRPDLGTVAAGAPADLLVFREDPTRDLEALASLEAVVAAGRVYTKDELDLALVRWQQHLRKPLRRAITRALARGAVAWFRATSAPAG